MEPWGILFVWIITILASVGVIFYKGNDSDIEMAIWFGIVIGVSHSGMFAHLGGLVGSVSIVVLLIAVVLLALRWTPEVKRWLLARYST